MYRKDLSLGNIHATSNISTLAIIFKFRYADVCVHRLLAAAIGVAPLPVHLSSKSYLHDLAANMNRRHRSAQLAGRASVQLHTLIFFSGDGAKEEDAYVLDVEAAEASDPFFTVIVPRYGIEGRVSLSNISADDPNLERDAENHRLIYRTGDKSVSVQVFDKVRVKIWVREVQEHQKELVLDLLDPKFGVGGDVEVNRKRALAEDPESHQSKRAKKSLR
jgi:exosome complex exonuclease DIS3/RRP44